MNIRYLLIMALAIASMIDGKTVVSVQEYLIYHPEEIKTKRSGNVLTLAHMKLSSLDGLQNIQNPETVEVLALYKNELKNITRGTFTKFPKLQTLTLNDNAITTFDPYSFAELKKLQLLQLSNNPLKKFNPQLLAGLQELRELHLENTQLDELDQFPELQDLEILYLNNNNFEQINPKVFAKLPKLKWLYLNNNPISKPENKAYRDSLKNALPGVEIKF